MGKLLFGVRCDIPTLAAVALLLGLAALLASYIPARRAASVNPVEALRVLNSDALPAFPGTRREPSSTLSRMLGKGGKSKPLDSLLIAVCTEWYIALDSRLNLGKPPE